jgi:hypothetical protein
MLHKEQQALLRQQEDMAICAEFAIGSDHFPKHLQAHAPPANVLDAKLKA